MLVWCFCFLIGLRIRGWSGVLCGGRLYKKGYALNIYLDVCYLLVAHDGSEFSSNLDPIFFSQHTVPGTTVSSTYKEA